MNSTTSPPPSWRWPTGSSGRWPPRSTVRDGPPPGCSTRSGRSPTAVLTGWIATSPSSPKAAHLAAGPRMSLTYWDPTHDTCTVDATTAWDPSDEGRRALWDRFSPAPAPLGYDPRIIPGWDSPSAPGFGVLELVPQRLRVMPGSLMLKGEGSLLTWRRPS